ncbi:hypothetical protein BS78_04G005900 [Paspalum vaginatum]|nr:hypothetical protein BS78_04G005900 [Paspalum vaginatum]
MHHTSIHPKIMDNGSVLKHGCVTCRSLLHKLDVRTTVIGSPAATGGCAYFQVSGAGATSGYHRPPSTADTQAPTRQAPYGGSPKRWVFSSNVIRRGYICVIVNYL